MQLGNSTDVLEMAEVEVWDVWGSAAPTIPTRTPTPSRTPTPTPTRTPAGTRTPAASPTPVTGLVQTVIDYDYDPLYRLTAANYSNGDYYHYGDESLEKDGYDAVGNRLWQETRLNGVVADTIYTYDDANRLTSVNGVPYTWDANGNLLHDGVNTYTYDSANRLKSMTGPSVAASYAYNGLGDRLRETLNGQPTNFTMDLNTGLTQALSDGTNTYIYGNSRLAQVNTGTEYFLGDALGSVRQLTNTSGAVTYASAYDPYGVTRQAYGVSQTMYGFTGEYTSNDLVYLRARHYAPGMGRFLTRDTWVGDATIPITYNRWQYANENPIMYTDPSGNCPFCIALLLGVPIIAGVSTGSWNYYVEQGHGVGGRNEFNPDCADWGQVVEAGKFGTFGAIEPFANIPLGIPQVILKAGYGMEPIEANEAWLSYVGLDDEYRAANANPYYVAGRQGGNIGSLTLSLHALFSGAPKLIAGPGVVANGSNTLVLSGTNVTAVGSDLSLVYTGTSGLASSWGNVMMLNSSNGTNYSGTYYRRGTPYTRKELISRGAIRVDQNKPVNVKSDDFADFIRSQGRNFRSNEWKKHMEEWELPDGTILHNHYWEHKSGETWYHGSYLDR